MTSWENFFSNLLLGDGDPEVSFWECGTPLCFQETKLGGGGGGGGAAARCLEGSHLQRRW